MYKHPLSKFLYDLLQDRSTVTTDNASCLMPLSLVSTQVPLISLVRIQQSSRSLQSSWLLTTHVISQWARERMPETNWIFEQTPPPYFWLKVVCKKGGHLSGDYSTSLVLRPCAFITCSTKFAQKAWSILSHDRATDICLHQTQHIVLYSKCIAMLQEPETGHMPII